MNDLIEQIPVFWQGVLASIVAGMILTILGYIFSTSIKQWRKNLSSHKNLKRIIANKLQSNGMIPRLDGSIFCLFQTVKYLFFANIFWVLPETVYMFGELTILIKLLSLFFFVMGLKWIYFYTSNQSSITLDNDVGDDER
ncbi:MAG: hypothetical protein KME67_19060 [Candidatus Thiodiazotropha sp. (ex Codakia orbicularis)]|nr:hypothetical protein [Candidatus Thiodiazotropha sp. (ex Codakia orbicularis)]